MSYILLIFYQLKINSWTDIFVERFWIFSGSLWTFCQKLQISEILSQYWYPTLVLKNVTNLIKIRPFFEKFKLFLKRFQHFIELMKMKKMTMDIFFLLSDFWNIVEYQNKFSLGTFWKLINFLFYLQLYLYWDYLNTLWIGWVNLQYGCTEHIFSVGNLRCNWY